MNQPKIIIDVSPTNTNTNIETNYNYNHNPRPFNEAFTVTIEMMEICRTFKNSMFSSTVSLYSHMKYELNYSLLKCLQSYLHLLRNVPGGKIIIAGTLQNVPDYYQIFYTI